MHRAPRWAEAKFFSRPRPAKEEQILVSTSRTAFRFALTLFLCGFLGALLYQLTGFGYLVSVIFIKVLPPVLAILVVFVITVLAALQSVAILQGIFSILALGAPLFEEFLKVGLALVICWNPANARGRVAMNVARVATALAVPLVYWWFTKEALWMEWFTQGMVWSEWFHQETLWAILHAILGLAACLGLAANSRPLVVAARLIVAGEMGFIFGWSEHFLYADEDFVSKVFRYTFHTGASMLSMAMYCVLETVRDTRVRWFSTIPASLLHYGNNAFAGFIALFAGLEAATGWSIAMAASTVLAIPVVALLRTPLRALAAHQAAVRFAKPVRAQPPGPTWAPAPGAP